MNIRKIALALGLCVAAGAAWSQPGDYPSKPIRLVIGFAPGGAADYVARAMSVAFGKALGLGFLLSAVNPKNLIIAAGAGLIIGSGTVGVGGDAAAIALFTVIASSTVAIPVLAHLVAAERMTQPLESLRKWLQDNNATVMATMILVIGVVLVGKGVSGL